MGCWLKYKKTSAVVGIRNAPCSVRQVNCWSPVDGTVRGGSGGAALLEKACHGGWGAASRLKASPTFSSLSLLCTCSSHVSAHFCTPTPPRGGSQTNPSSVCCLGHGASSQWKSNRCDISQQRNHKHIRHCCAGWFCAACHKPKHYLGRGNLDRKRDVSIKLVCGILP